MIKKLRKAARRHLGRAMAAIFGAEAGNEPLDAVRLRRVLIVRVNGRMGNTLFLAPLVEALAAHLPEARIDVLSMYPEAPDLLRGLPGLERVLVLPHKSWWRLGRVRSLARAVRAVNYDLVIDPSPDSFGNRLAMTFCRSRWRLGFSGANQWVALSHAVQPPQQVRHTALKPLALLARLPGAPVQCATRLRITLDADERAAAAARLASCLEAAVPGGVAQRPVVGFFAHARGRKALGQEWWRRFWERLLLLAPDIMPVEVLPSPEAAQVLPGRPALHEASIRQLSAIAACMDTFISADTGPMHLASATAVPVVALFGPTDPARFGPLKAADTVVRLAGLSPEDVALRCAPLVARTRASTPP